MARPRPETLARALAVPRYVLATLEFATTFAALTLVYGFGPMLREVCVVSVVPVALLFLGRRLYEDRRRVVPLTRLVKRSLTNELDAAERDALAEALVAFPRRVVFVRLIAWAIATTLIVTVMSVISGLAWPDIFAVTGICLGVALVFLMWRAQWIRHATERALLPALAGADVGRYLGHTIRERLFVAAYLPIAAGAVLAGLYDWLFLALPLESLRGLFMAVPPLTLLLTLTFAALMFRWTTPLRAHLAGRPLAGPGDGPWKLRDGTVDPGPRVALHVATSLPYRAALLSLALWSGCAGFVGIVRVVNYGPWREGVLLFAGLMAVGVLAALLQVAWSRLSLQPARELCSRELGITPVSELWPQVRVRDRVVAVVLAVLFASGTFTYTTLYLQQREIMIATAGNDAQVALDELWPEIESTVAAAPDERRDLIARLAERAREPMVLVESGSVAWKSAGLSIASRPTQEILGGRARVALPGPRLTIGLRPLRDGVFVGLARPWRDFQGVYGVGGLTLLFGILGLVAFVIALVAANDITGPIEALRRFARELGRGELNARLPAPDPDEVGELGLALDKMRGDLRAQIQAVVDLNQSLEQKVVDRTAELRSAQAQLVHGEKMASVGRLAAGVAHEINNPLNFIANALGPMETTLRDVKVVMALEAAGDANGARREQQQRQLDASLAELDDLVRVMRNGIQRTQQIVRGLRDFSRSDDAEQRRDTDIAALCDETLALLRHELEERIDVVRHYASDSRVACYPGAMGQVLMNLIANAAQSIPGHGQIEITTEHEGDRFVIAVSDSGTGIPAEVLSRIFDPFFTTKDVGKGSGLGLSIVHGIVERHGGRVEVDSQPGLGTTFRVRLPTTEALAKAS